VGRVGGEPPLRRYSLKELDRGKLSQALETIGVRFVKPEYKRRDQKQRNIADKCSKGNRQEGGVQGGARTPQSEGEGENSG